MRTISSINSSRFPTRVYLKFSDGFYLPFFIDDVFLLKLKKDQSFDDEKFDLILKSSIFYLLKESALRQVSYSPKSRIALQKKLSVSLKKNLIKYKISFRNEFREIINDVISKLASQGLLKDDDFIKYFIKKNQKKSRQEINYLLKQQGFSDYQIKDIYFEGNDREKIKKILAKKNFQQDDFSDFAKKNKIMSSLYRKGFSLSDIKATIDDFLNLK
jgi:SOS response regulatory protein OraA/RecX